MDFEGEVLRLIDQRVLPQAERWVDCRDLESVAKAIEDMVIRGAPAIGCSAAFGVVIEARLAAKHTQRWGDYRAAFARGIDRLARTRPTAVNLFYALNRMRALGDSFGDPMAMSEGATELAALAQALFDDDVATCKAIGRHGADAAGGRKLRVLTHCNAGALATAGYGTALGVIRSLHERGQIELVFADETRPWLQGSRLTAYELKCEGIPHKVIADSTAAYLMQQGKIDWVVVGADRIARNGDTANKIGTYSVAVNAKYHGVEFFVAAPLSTFDFKIATGKDIPVEERSPEEVSKYSPVYNPSFDVTPHALISGIITEQGVLRAPYGEKIATLAGK